MALVESQDIQAIQVYQDLVALPVGVVNQDTQVGVASRVIAVGRENRGIVDLVENPAIRGSQVKVVIVELRVIADIAESPALVDIAELRGLAGGVVKAVIQGLVA